VSFLLDTNVVSEWVKPNPNPYVVAWLAEVDEDRVFLSVAPLAEIRRGVELMPAGKRRGRLFDWLTSDLPARFEGRILNIDQRTAETWGIIMARGPKSPRSGCLLCRHGGSPQADAGDPQRSALPEAGYSFAESLGT
jgi:toxin FitB